MEAHNNIPHNQERNSEKTPDDVTKDIEDVDSPINKDYNRQPDGNESLTNDEDADTDPNEVDDKPSFTNDNH